VQQFLGGEEARRSGAENGDVQRACGAAKLAVAGGILQPDSSLSATRGARTETTSFEGGLLLQRGAGRRWAHAIDCTVTDQHTR
jgi:hypothetical protein